MLHCSRCQRTHPDEAAFCYFDGTRLRGEGVVTAVQAAPTPETLGQLPFAFVFPWGLRCQTFDELIQGCQQDWPAARTLFEQGAFQQFLTSAGRLDLARTSELAREQSTDADIALAKFLAKLPALKPLRPELELQPRKLLLDPLPANETRTVELLVLNTGSGFLHGSIQIADAGDWLRFAGGSLSCDLKTMDQQSILLEVRTQGLAAPQELAGRLAVVSSGGIVEVPVRLAVAVRPFAEAPFAGALTPRDLAARMRKQPKEAVALLEGGQVARWFGSNGWRYPVEGSSASGIPAVQQFFEALKLTKPPIVTIEPAEIQLECIFPNSVSVEALLQTSERKWVHGQVSASAPWIRVGTPRIAGPQKAAIQFEAESAALEPDQNHEGTVTVQANGGQEVHLRVKLAVRRPVSPRRPSWVPRLALGALIGLLLRLAAAPVMRWANLDQTDGGMSGAALIRHFILVLGWLGVVAGLLLVPRRPGWRWTDLASAALAGGAGGVVAAATLACLLPWLEAGPSQLLPALPHPLALGMGYALLGAVGAFLCMRLTAR